MSARQYSNKAVATTLAGAIGSGDTTISLGSTSGFPASFPYTLVIEPGSVSQEVVTVTALAGSVATVTRGQDGTTAVSHGNGVDVKHQHTARDFQEPQAHFDATTGVHGVGGGLVMGTTLTQTVKNKTFVPPDAASTALVVQGVNAQTAALQQWKDSTGGVGAFLSAAFAFVSKALQVNSAAAGVVPFTLTAAASPTVDQLQIFDSTNTKQVWVDSTFNVHGAFAGNLTGNVTGNTTGTHTGAVTGDVTAATVTATSHVQSPETTGGSGRSAMPYGSATFTFTSSDGTLQTLGTSVVVEASDTNFPKTDGTLVVPVAGVYDFFVQVIFSSPFSGTLRVGIKKNGTYVGRQSCGEIGSGTTSFGQATALGVRCAASDVISFDLFQNSGGTLLTTTGSGFTGEWRRP